MFQHTAQRKFLNRWKVDGRYLYRITKGTRTVKTFQSAKRIEGFGAEDWQSNEMETAFADVEGVVGYTDVPGEILDPKKIMVLARWLALHFVRARRHREIALANERDYRIAVDLVRDRIATYYGFFADFSRPVFITGDNPIVLVGTPSPGPPEWIAAPLSPTRCIYVMSQDHLPCEPGIRGLRPSSVNELIYREATEFCLSFDRSLHLP